MVIRPITILMDAFRDVENKKISVDGLGIDAGGTMTDTLLYAQRGTFRGGQGQEQPQG